MRGREEEEEGMGGGRRGGGRGEKNRKGGGRGKFCARSEKGGGRQWGGMGEVRGRERKRPTPLSAPSLLFVIIAETIVCGHFEQIGTY